MSSRTFEFTLTIVIPAEDQMIQVSVSSPRRISQPRQVPSAPLKKMPALVDDPEEQSHHSAARSLYAEFNLTQKPIEPLDATSAKPYDFSTNSTIKPFPAHYKYNLILSLKCRGAVGIPLEHYRRLKDFLANVNHICGHTTPEHIVDLYEDYDSWVKTMPEKELRHLNRYQRMTRFLNKLQD